MPVDAFIALGSNLGDRAALIKAALCGVARLPAVRLVRVSSVVETDPVGPPGQGPYLNAAAHLSTELNPAELLAGLFAVERELARNRQTDQRWGPRRIDLDLLFFGHYTIDAPGLRVPHPRLHERDFVLRPLAQIAPDLTHPLLGRSITELLAGTPTASRR